MKFLSYLFFLLCPLVAWAQGTAYTPSAQVIELATWMPTATPIKGHKYLFDDKMHSYHICHDKKEIILLTRKEKEINIGAEGELLVFDMATNTVKWKTRVNTFNIYITDEYIISSEKGNTHCYRRSDGKQMWKKTEANVKYIDGAKGLVITDYIRALNIHTGKIAWQKYLPVKYNWEDVQKLDDSSILVATGGLYKINLYTGKGWSTNGNDITTKEEFNIPTALGAIPPAPAFPEVAIPEFSGIPGAWKSTTSGMLIDNDVVYIATNKRLLSINLETGGLESEIMLPKGTGISSLFSRDGQITIINEGKVSYSEKNTKRYGRPYIATYSIADGSQVFLTGIRKESILRDVAWSTEGVNMLLDSALLRYSTGSKEPWEPLPHCDTVQFYSFLLDVQEPTARNWYFFNGDKCEPYTEFDDKSFVLHTSDGIYALKNTFDVYKNNFLPGEVSADRKYILFYKNGQTLIADNANVLYNDKVKGIIIKAPPGNKGFIHGDKLYIVETGSVSIIPLAEPK